MDKDQAYISFLEKLINNTSTLLPRMICRGVTKEEIEEEISTWTGLQIVWLVKAKGEDQDRAHDIVMKFLSAHMPRQAVDETFEDTPFPTILSQY